MNSEFKAENLPSLSVDDGAKRRLLDIARPVWKNAAQLKPMENIERTLSIQGVSEMNTYHYRAYLLRYVGYKLVPCIPVLAAAIAAFFVYRHKAKAGTAPSNTADVEAPVAPSTETAAPPQEAPPGVESDNEGHDQQVHSVTAEGPHGSSDGTKVWPRSMDDK